MFRTCDGVELSTTIQLDLSPVEAAVVVAWWEALEEVAKAATALRESEDEYTWPLWQALDAALDRLKATIGGKDD